MDTGNLHRQEFLSLKEMVEIGFRVEAVGLAAIGINRGEVCFPLLIAHIHRAVVSEEHRIATVTGRHHTVEHIYAALNGFENVLRRTYTHQITGLVFGQNFVDYLDHLIHHLSGFAHCQSTDCIAFGSFVSYEFSGFLP